jgi:hypothetical protein
VDHGQSHLDGHRSAGRRLCPRGARDGARLLLQCRPGDRLISPSLGRFVSQSLPLGATIARFSAFASGIMVVMLLLLPETRGRSLASLEAAPADWIGRAPMSGEQGAVFEPGGLGQTEQNTHVLDPLSRGP